VANGYQFLSKQWTKGFGPGIGGIFADLTFNSIELFVLLLVAQTPERNGIKANPGAIFPYACCANRLPVFAG
jgi:hypothetical protein